MIRSYKDFPYTWPDILREFENHRARGKVSKFMWEFPQQGWLNYNTNGASRGNSVISSYAFCLRDDQGDLLYAKGDNIDDTINIEAEAEAIL